MTRKTAQPQFLHDTGLVDTVICIRPTLRDVSGNV